MSLADALTRFRDDLQPVLVAWAWRATAPLDADDRAALDALGHTDVAGRLVDSPAAHDLAAAGLDPAVMALAEVLVLEQAGVGPPAGWLRAPPGGRSAAYGQLAAALRLRRPGLGEGAWRALADVHRRADIPAGWRPLLRHLLAEVCREEADPAQAADAAFTLVRAAADDGTGPARHRSLDPLPVPGHPAWALQVELRPTLEHDLHHLDARLVSRADPAPEPPTVAFRLSAEGPLTGWRLVPAPPGRDEAYVGVPPGAALHLAVRVAD